MAKVTVKDVLTYPSITLMFGIFTGRLFSEVIMEHNYNPYVVVAFVILSIYSIWYLTSLFIQIFKKTSK